MSFERAAKSYFVAILEVPTYWDTACKTGDCQVRVVEQPGQVRLICHTLEIGISGDSGLGDWSITHSRKKLRDAQFTRADAVDRADSPTKNVVEPAELARTLDRGYVPRLFQNTDPYAGASRISADCVCGLFSDIAVNLAKPHLLAHIDEQVRPARNAENSVCRVWMKRPGSDGDSRYLIPTSCSRSVWSA